MRPRMKDDPATSFAGDRAFAIAVLLALCGLAWAYLLYLAWGMAHMEVGVAMAIMPRMASWQSVDLALVFAMWAIMMIAMMLPSAAPMMLLFAALSRKLREPRSRGEFFTFVGGYVAVWSGFSVLATLMQWGLLEARLVSPMMQASTPWLSGVLLLAAGLYQLTPLKQACLARCRSPLAFLTEEWRKGLRGAFVMGVRHGLFCLGCCWLAMLLLFVLGIMNVVWIVALAAFILAEKTLPRSRWLSTTGGLVFILWGVALFLVDMIG
jgi:predicted metal-binding membrane protein